MGLIINSRKLTAFFINYGTLTGSFVLFNSLTIKNIRCIFLISASLQLTWMAHY